MSDPASSIRGMNLNWIAVLAGGAAAWILGALWYSPLLFSNAWLRALDKTEAQIKSAGTPPALALGGNFLGWLVASAVMRTFVQAMPEPSPTTGLVTGVLAFAGFTLPLLLNTWLFEGRSRALFFVNAPYQLLGCLVLG